MSSINSKFPERPSYFIIMMNPRSGNQHCVENLAMAVMHLGVQENEEFANRIFMVSNLCRCFRRSGTPWNAYPSAESLMCRS